MLTHIELHNILSRKQHGFRKQYSTNTATASLVEHIAGNNDSKKFTPLLLYYYLTFLKLLTLSVITSYYQNYNTMDLVEHFLASSKTVCQTECSLSGP